MYEHLLKSAYENVTIPADASYSEAFKQNIDTYGKYSVTLCRMWKESGSIMPLSAVPFVINMIPTQENEVLRMADVCAYVNANKERYSEFNSMKGAIKGLTPVMAAATDVMLEKMDGMPGIFPPVNVLGVKNDTSFLPFLCRRLETGEHVQEFEEVMKS